MTYAEDLRQEGFKRGFNRGFEQGFEQSVVKSKQTILIRLLSRRFSLIESEHRRIESCEDRASLDTAIDEVVVADSKDSVLAKLP